MTSWSFLIPLFLFTQFSLADGLLRVRPYGSHFTKPLGSSIVFTCEYQSITDISEESLGWFKNNQSQILSGIGRVHTEWDDNSILKLYITSIDQSDSGEYECVSGNYMQKVYLQLFKDISFESASLNQHPVIYTDALIRCIASGQPVPDISWRYQGHRILTGGRYTVVAEGLRISNASLVDDGVYTCRAEVDADGRYDERRINVSVYVPPKISLPIGKLQVVSGKDVSLHCQASGIPLPAYQYFKNGVEVSNSSLVTEDAATGVLLIRNVTKQDEGPYECLAHNPVGRTSDFAFVHVLVPPTITLMQNQTGLEGERVEVHCEATADPKPEITLYRSNSVRELEEDDKILLIRKPNSLTLVIHSLSINDSDIYTCIATNAIGLSEKKTVLIVQYKPRLTGHPPSLVYGWPGHTSRLLCSFASQPIAAATWLLGGQPIESDGNIFVITTTPSFTEMLITVDKRYSEKHLFTEYVCSLKNYIGNISHTFNFQEAFVPDAPQVEIMSRRADEVSLSVTNQLYMGVMQVFKYVVEFSAMALEFTILPNSTNNNLYIDGLTPNSSYLMQVKAINQVGSSLATFVHITTDILREPERMELNSSFTGRHAYVYIASWLPVYHGGSTILGLKIKLRQVSKTDSGLFEKQSEWREIQISPSQAANNQYLIDDLRPDTHYQLEASALNAFGRSKSSPEFYFKTAPGEVSLFPALLHTSSTSLIILSILIAFILFLVVIDIACYRINGCGISSLVCAKVCHQSQTPPNKINGASEKEKLTESAPITDNITVVSHGPLRSEPILDEPQEPILNHQADTEEIPMMPPVEPELVMPSHRRSILSGYGDARWMDVVHELELQLGTKQKEDKMISSVHEKLQEDEEEYLGAESPKWTLPDQVKFQLP